MIVILYVSPTFFEILTKLAPKQLVFPIPTLVWRLLAEERLAISMYSIHHWKVHLTVTSPSLIKRWHMGLSSFILAVVGSQICEIPRNSKIIWTYSSSRSSKVINLGANRKRICDFLLVINSNLGRISYRFWDINFKARKIACFPTHPCLTPRSDWTCWNFLDETTPLKLEGWGYRMVKIS